MSAAPSTEPYLNDCFYKGNNLRRVGSISRSFVMSEVMSEVMSKSRQSTLRFPMVKRAEDDSREKGKTESTYTKRYELQTKPTKSQFPSVELHSPSPRKKAM